MDVLDLDVWGICALLAVALAAGWLDAVVGGGGLIQIPALLFALPGASVATVLGTNKLVAITGTSSAAVAYSRKVPVDWRPVAAAGLAGIPASVAGALTASHLPQNVFRPAVMAVLVLAAAWVAWPGRSCAPKDPHTHRSCVPLNCLLGAVVGFYSGVLGSGTGVLLVMAFVSLLGSDFLRGSAMAKVVSVGTDLGALALFAALGHVLWTLGAGMAVANVAGGTLGARTALRRGSAFVRVALLCVVLALVAKLAHDTWV
ncbi:sulfite exporter TauE/SafE family protein [Streptomyces sp. NBC_01465]|uniref:sulfite exporter TauE/SafE family protein n=1 Tax=Streptomyces sp. NBC_01465 TaxID=2903878 RepID=UPI002E37BD8B|nr:TSUP family transporter [Streptomyces sp. NBC_01465]